jgi:hypothetical protein
MNIFDINLYRPIKSDDLIRVGRNYDGGYVLPKRVVDDIDALLSLGVNLDWSFEKHFLKLRPELDLVCVDGTTGIDRAIKKMFQKFFDCLGHLITLQWTKAFKDAQFFWVPIGFWRFFLRYPLVKKMVSNLPGKENITLGELIDYFLARGKNKIFIKMDIEGSEFGVLPEVAKYKKFISGLVIEFHNIEAHWQEFVALMGELMSDYYVSHIHGNNFEPYIQGTKVPRTLEITLVQKSLYPVAPNLNFEAYPLNGLDMPCNSKFEDLKLFV